MLPSLDSGLRPAHSSQEWEIALRIFLFFEDKPITLHQKKTYKNKTFDRQMDPSVCLLGVPHHAIWGDLSLYETQKKNMQLIICTLCSSFCCHNLALILQIPGSYFSQLFPLVSQVGTSLGTFSGSGVEFWVGRGQKYISKGKISSIFPRQLPTNPEGGVVETPPGVPTTPMPTCDANMEHKKN